MKKIILFIVCLFLVSCAPRISRVDQAYQNGRLTEAQYLQLKIMERQADEMDTANILSIMNAGRWTPPPYQWPEIPPTRGGMR